MSCEMEITAALVKLFRHPTRLRTKERTKTHHHHHHHHQPPHPHPTPHHRFTWGRHQMEALSALLALLCAGILPFNEEFPPQTPVTRSFDVFFDLRLNKRLSKQSWGWWFERPSHSLWRHCNVSPWWESYGCLSGKVPILWKNGQSSHL